MSYYFEVILKTKNNALLLLLVSFFTLYSCSLNTQTRNPAQSQEIAAKYGPEFSFSNPQIIAQMNSAEDLDNPTTKEYLEKWKVVFDKLCAPDKCIVTLTNDKHGKAYRVTFPDGWWYQAGLDVGCLEVQTKPLTLEDFLKRKYILDEFIFDSAKELNLIPHERIGGGHLNIDLATAFPDNNAKLFRNFIVDQANHPELVWGMFGNHLGNSPPISALEPHLHDVFKSVIEEFDSLDDTVKGEKAIRELGREVQRRVYVSNPFWLANDKKVWYPDYYQHLSFRSIGLGTPVEQRRLELRGFRPQQSVKEFLLELEFFDARLNYLNKLTTPLEVKIPKHYEMPIEIKKNKFREIIHEIGLDQEKFSHFTNSKVAYSNRVFPTPDVPTTSPPPKLKENCSAAVGSFY